MTFIQARNGALRPSVRRWPDGRPVRPEADRIERRAHLAACALAVLALPASAAAAMLAATALGDVATAQRADRYRATATVQSGPEAGTGGADVNFRVALVTWADAAGNPHAGRARVASGDPVGSTVGIWASPAGTVVDAPLSGAAAAFYATCAGLGTEAAALGIAGAGIWVVRRRLDRRHDRDWARGWEAAAATWARDLGDAGLTSDAN